MINAMHGPSTISPSIVAVFRDEKRRLEELMQLLEAGLLTDHQFNAGLKHLERTLRCLRYSRQEPLAG